MKYLSTTALALILAGTAFAQDDQQPLPQDQTGAEAEVVEEDAVDGDTAAEIEDDAEEAAETVEEGAEATGEAIEEGAENAGEAIEDGAEATGEAVEDGIEETGEALQETGEAVEEGAEEAAEETGEAVEETTDATEDAAVFTPGVLRDYGVIVFLNTTGDVLDEHQQQAFEAWFRDGGGYLGVHSASDTEYDWPWYGQLVGAYFRGHPAIQEARIAIVTPDHPATAHLSKEWIRTDEWYDFRAAPVAARA